MRQRISTYQGKGFIIAKGFKLKTVTPGWLKSFIFADQDFFIKLSLGTIVDVVKLDSGGYVIIKEAKMSDFGIKRCCHKVVRFENDLLDEVKTKNQDVSWMENKEYSIKDEYLDIKVDFECGNIDVDHELSELKSDGFSIIFIDMRTGEIMELVYKDSDEPEYLVRSDTGYEELKSNSYTETVDFITNQYKGA